MHKLGLLLLAPALAMPAAAAPPGELRTDEGQKRVCRPAAPSLGSHIKRSKICRTAAEWEEWDRARRAADLTVKAPQPEPWERTRPQ
jgi:hypothetical protein